MKLRAVIIDGYLGVGVLSVTFTIVGGGLAMMQGRQVINFKQ